MDRLAPLFPKDMTEEQLAYYRHIRERPSYADAPEGEPLVGPSSAYQRCVPYGRLKDAMSRYLRHDGLLPGPLRELTIITVCRIWNADFAFNEHARLARREGVGDAVIDAIRKGDAPSFEKSDEKTVYRFVRQLTDTKSVDDETYRAALDLLGEAALVELIGLCGHYVTACMTINAFEMPPRDGDEKLPAV